MAVETLTANVNLDDITPSAARLFPYTATVHASRILSGTVDATLTKNDALNIFYSLDGGATLTLWKSYSTKNEFLIINEGLPVQSISTSVRTDLIQLYAALEVVGSPSASIGSVLTCDTVGAASTETSFAFIF